MRPLYADVLSLLVDHFSELLCLEREDFAPLAREVYQNGTNYLLFFNRLNHAERNVNAALRPNLKKTVDGVNGFIKTIEMESEKTGARAPAVFFRKP